MSLSFNNYKETNKARMLLKIQYILNIKILSEKITFKNFYYNIIFEIIVILNFICTIYILKNP